MALSSVTVIFERFPSYFFTMKRTTTKNVIVIGYKVSEGSGRE